jgi:hypothetical protein
MEQNIGTDTICLNKTAAFHIYADLCEGILYFQ